MPLYYFTIVPARPGISANLTVDCIDLEAARAHGRRTLAGLGFDQILNGEGALTLKMLIEDVDRRSVSTLALMTCLRIDAVEADGSM